MMRKLLLGVLLMLTCASLTPVAAADDPKIDPPMIDPRCAGMATQDGDCLGVRRSDSVGEPRDWVCVGHYANNADCTGVLVYAEGEPCVGEHGSGGDC